VQLEGVLLDVDYITIDGRAVVRLWIRSEEGAVIALCPYSPYFYAIPQGPHALEAIKKLEGISDCMTVQKKDVGRDVEAIKVIVDHPSNVPKLREIVASLPGVRSVREADIPFGIRFVIDKGLVPMGGVQATGKPHSDTPVPTVWADTVSPVDIPLTGLRLLAFDLETYNPSTTPDPTRDPIIIISVATTDRLEALSGTEDEMIRRLYKLVLEEDPDVIFTYNGDNFDWPYLAERARIHGVSLDLGRDHTPVKIKRKVRNIVSVAGRSNVDLYKIAQRDLGEVKIKTLKSVADHLGVLSTSDRVMIPKEKIAECWDSDRETLLQYARDDAQSTLGLGELLLPMQMELCRLIKQPLGDEVNLGRGRQVEWYLMAEGYKVGELVPPRQIVKAGMYEGGFVLPPKKGIHEHVACLDFSSMYPSIMIAHNISPDTLVGNETPSEECYVAPETGYRFKKRPDGFYKRILLDLVGKRRTIKEQMRTVKPGPEHRLLEIRQHTLKILTNAFYGYCGWPGAKWYRRECAEATAAWGRYMIRKVIARAGEKGIEVLYGDTDSVFIRHTDEVPQFIGEINALLPLELELQEVYDVIFFTGKKKRYAGLTQDGRLIIRGLEVRRGDWCELAKQIQKETIDTILKKRDPEAAGQRVRETIRRLKDGHYNVEELTIHKTITRAPDRYKAIQAHVLAATKGAKKGIEFTVGGKVGYVILRGPGKMSDRAKLVQLLTPQDEIDAQYYIDHQILPTTLRILEYFDYTADDLKGSPTQLNLDQWF